MFLFLFLTSKNLVCNCSRTPQIGLEFHKIKFFIKKREISGDTTIIFLVNISKLKYQTINNLKLSLYKKSKYQNVKSKNIKISKYET